MTLEALMAQRAAWERDHDTKAATCAISPKQAEALREELSEMFDPGYVLTSVTKNGALEAPMFFVTDPALTGDAIRFEGARRMTGEIRELPAGAVLSIGGRDVTLMKAITVCADADAWPSIQIAVADQALRRTADEATALTMLLTSSERLDREMQP